MTAAEIQAGIDELGPWFYRFDFGAGLETKPSIPPQVEEIFSTRLQMLESVLGAHFGVDLSQLDCLDIGCHEGFYSLALARKNARSVLGIDARSENLRRARFVAEALGITSVEYRQAHVESLESEIGKQFPLTLFFGVLYHVENPMLCLRNVAAVTGELCVLETQVVEEVEAEAEWGSREWTRPYQGILALIDETGEFRDGNRETGVTPMATCPSRKALQFMLKQSGFQRSEFIPPPPGAYEQHARGKRVVVAAYK